MRSLNSPSTAASPAIPTPQAGWRWPRVAWSAATVGALAALAAQLHPPSAIAAPVLYVLAAVAAGLVCRPKNLIALAATMTLVAAAGHAGALVDAQEPPDRLVATLSVFGVWSTALLLRLHRCGFLGDGGDDGFRAVMETAADAIVVLDTHGRINRFNAAAERLFGYAAAEVIGNDVSMLMPEPHHAAHARYLDRYMKTRDPRIIGKGREVEILHRDGTRIPVHLTLGEGRGDGGRYFVGIIHDIRRRKKTERVLRRLHEIAAAANLDIDAKIECVLELGADYFQLETGMLCRAENGILSIRNIAPPTTRLDGDTAFAAAHAHLLATVAAHDAIDAANADAVLIDALKVAESDPAAGYLGVPVIVDWSLHGVLCFVGSAPLAAPVTEGEREMLRLLAHWIAFEVGRAAQIQALSEAQEELRRQAQTDGLTGILNRRHFMRTARIELERSIRYDHPLGLILLDADHFKAVNDTHGHAAGDAVLMALAQTCGRMLRGSDAFGRIGGEEFALLLPESDLAATRLVAERIRQTVAGLRVPNGDAEISVTASLGVTARQAADIDILTMIRRADRALYQAKANGRNRCVVLSQ